MSHEVYLNVFNWGTRTFCKMCTPVENNTNFTRTGIYNKAEILTNNYVEILTLLGLQLNSSQLTKRSPAYR